MTIEPQNIFAVNLYSYVFSQRAGDTVRRLADQGYRGFELMMFPGHLWHGKDNAAQRAELRRVQQQAGVRFLSTNMPNIDINVAAVAPEMRAYSLLLLENLIETTGELGIPGMVIGPGKANPLFPAPPAHLRDFFFAALDRLVPVAERNGVTLLLENMPFAFLPDAESIVAALDDYGHDGIGIVYDVANAHFIGEDPAEGLRRVRSRLRLVHVSDTGRQVYKHDAVGLGDVPFASVATALGEVEYDELPVLEIISHDPDRDTGESAAKLAAAGFALSAQKRC